MKRLALLLLVISCSHPDRDLASCHAVESSMQGLARCLVDRHGWDGTVAADSAWSVISKESHTFQEEIQCVSALHAILPAQGMRDCLIGRYGWLPKQADSVATKWAEMPRQSRP